MSNSFYDDPVWQESAGDDRIKFTLIGDSVRGRITNLKVIQIMGDRVPIATLADVVARQEGREVRMVTADLSLGLTHLQRIWKTEKPEIGDVVEAVFVESKNVGQPQPQKRFSFTVTRAGSEARQHEQAIRASADGTQGDLFG